MELRGGGFLQLAEHLRPEVAAEFGVARGRDCLLEEIFHLFVVPFATQALAMLLYGSSSIRASVATRRYFAGSSWKAVLMRSRDSRRIAGSAPVAHGRSSGKPDSRRECRRWSKAALVAMRRAQARKLPSDWNRDRAL